MIFKIRALWHSITHTHVLMEHPDGSRLQMCFKRLKVSDGLQGGAVKEVGQEWQSMTPRQFIFWAKGQGIDTSSWR